MTHLQPRQLACLRLAAEGHGYVEIGQQLGIARSTVKTQLKRVMTTLEARNTTQAVHIAHQLGLLDACDCGHEGLPAMFHLRPCPIATQRKAAGA